MKITHKRVVAVSQRVAGIMAGRSEYITSRYGQDMWSQSLSASFEMSAGHRGEGCRKLEARLEAARGEEHSASIELTIEAGVLAHLHKLASWLDWAEADLLRALLMARADTLLGFDAWQRDLMKRETPAVNVVAFPQCRVVACEPG